MKKLTLIILIAALFLTACEVNKQPEDVENSNDNLYSTDLPKQLEPKNLLVLIFNYNNGSYTGSDEEVEAAWSEYIFGTGSYEQGTASINDYFKEISNGNFYFNPILLDGSSTGVYSFHLNKDYSDEQRLYPEWPYHDFNYDTMLAIESLKDKGLDISQFAAEGINNANFEEVLINYWDAPQEQRNPQWYSTSAIMCIYPTYNKEYVDFFPLSKDIDSFALKAHINYDSSFGTIAHELIHTLGAVDVYNFGSYGSDLMSDIYPRIPEPYNTVHINPFYKIIYGWAEPVIITNSENITLYPPDSDKYNPVIVRTEDNNQYYILENRKSEQFDSGLDISGSDGINIWRIDKLGCEAIYNNERKGIILEALLHNNGESAQVRHYVSSEDINDTQEELSGITVTYIGKNPDGSIDVSVIY